MALKEIEHLYAVECHCGTRASRHRWRLVGAIGIIGVFTMAAVGHDAGSQAATGGTSVQPDTDVTSQLQPTPQGMVERRYVSPASMTPPPTDQGCNVARIAGAPDACRTN